jgi:DNA-binding IclR family transcriptional regulator
MRKAADDASWAASLVNQHVAPQAAVHPNQSLVLGLAVLRCFDSNHMLLSIADIGRRIGVTKPTAWRYCHTLLHAGYLTRPKDSDRLQVSRAVMSLGAGAHELAARVVHAALPRMTEITFRTGAGVALSVVDQTDLVLVYRSMGGGVLAANSGPGSRMSMAASASGWAYLATLAAKQRAQVLAQLETRHRSEWHQLKPLIGQAVRQYEKLGFVTKKHYFPNMNSAASPVFDGAGNAIFLLGCLGSTASFDTAHLKSIVGPTLVEVAHFMAGLVERDMVDANFRKD